MKTYGIYIKSHCEAVDYEDEVEARSKEEAAELFSSRLPRVEVMIGKL